MRPTVALVSTAIQQLSGLPRKSKENGATRATPANKAEIGLWRRTCPNGLCWRSDFSWLTTC